MLKELVPVMEVRETEYRELKSLTELKELAKSKAPLAIAFEFAAAPKPKIEEEEPEEGEQKSGDLLSDGPPAPESNALAPLKLALPPVRQGVYCGRGR